MNMNMMRVGWIVLITVCWTLVSNTINKMAGVEFSGWYSWVWDMPAYFAGALIGYFLGKWKMEKLMIQISQKIDKPPQDTTAS